MTLLYIYVSIFWRVSTIVMWDIYVYDLSFMLLEGVWGASLMLGASRKYFT